MINNMKQKLTIRIALATLLTMGYALSAAAYDFMFNGIAYTIERDTTRVAVSPAETPYSGDIVIPDTVYQGDRPFRVVAIGDSAFTDCTGLTSIQLSNTIMTIWEAAFKGCVNLSEITLPTSLGTIVKSAFEGCTALKTIHFPKYTIYIGEYAFKDCTALEQVTSVHDYIYKIGEGAFMNCTNLQEFNSTGRIDEFKPSTFAGCASLMSFKLPYPAPAITDHMFDGCKSLTEVTLNNGHVKTIGVSAFEGCESLETINIPATVTKVSKAAFRNCPALQSLSGMNKVKEIGDSAFIDCTRITSLPTLSALTQLGISAFEGCSGLTNIFLPATLTKIGARAFKGCVNITHLQYNATDCANPASSDEAWFADAKLKTINIGSNVQVIPAFFAFGQNEIKQITIPNSVTYIGGQAFRNCTGLQSISIGTSVAKMSKDALKGCTGLKKLNFNAKNCDPPYYGNPPYTTSWFSDAQLEEIVIGDLVEFVPASFALHQYQLKRVVIGKSVTTMGENAFANCGNTSISLTYNAINCRGVNDVNNTWFGGTGIKEFTIGDEVEVIPAYFMNGRRIRTSLVLGNSVREICKNAFAWNTTLTELVLPESLTTIGDRAFYCCNQLPKLVIPASVTTIGSEAFAACNALTSVSVKRTIPSQTKENTFSEETYQNVPLKVPEGCEEKYKKAKYWKLFQNIISSSAVDEIITDSPVTSRWYYDTLGCVSTTPFNGLNIVVTIHENGTITTQKEFHK